MSGNPNPNEDRKETYLTLAEAADYLRVQYTAGWPKES